MSSTTNTTGAAAPAPTVTGTPIHEGLVHKAIEEAIATVDSIDEELDEAVEDIAKWLHKEFHMIPKTAEEKTAEQNVAAGAANTNS